MTTKTEWTDEQIAALGTMPDAKLAKEMGIHFSTVAQKRWDLAIPSWHSKRPPYDARKKKAEYYQRTKDQHTDHKMKAAYGVSLTEYGIMLEEQGGGCAICGKTPAEEGHRLAVDHEHESGIVRGLLCKNCNRGLGMFQDDQALLLRAVEYLGGTR